jgi:hypothetical protein
MDEMEEAEETMGVAESVLTQQNAAVETPTQLAVSRGRGGALAAPHGVVPEGVPPERSRRAATEPAEPEPAAAVVDSALASVCALGFPEEAASVALAACSGNVQQAIESLLAAAAEPAVELELELEHTEQAVIASLPQLLEQMQNEADQTRRELNVRPILARIEQLHAETIFEENLLGDLPEVASDGWAGMPDVNEVTLRAARMRREEAELRDTIDGLMRTDDDP